MSAAAFIKNIYIKLILQINIISFYMLYLFYNENNYEKSNQATSIYKIIFTYSIDNDNKILDDLLVDGNKSKSNFFFFWELGHTIGLI